MTRPVSVVLLALLAACGGGSPPPPTASALAERIGCTDVEMTTGQKELGAREEAACSLDGESLTILTYSSNEPRDTAQAIAEGFGGVAVVGDRFTVRTDTQATAERVQETVGGEIR